MVLPVPGAGLGVGLLGLVFSSCVGACCCCRSRSCWLGNNKARCTHELVAAGHVYAAAAVAISSRLMLAEHLLLLELELLLQALNLLHGGGVWWSSST